MPIVSWSIIEQNDSGLKHKEHIQSGIVECFMKPKSSSKTLETYHKHSLADMWQEPSLQVASDEHTIQIPLVPEKKNKRDYNVIVHYLHEVHENERQTF